ncbi:hypothetical protein CTAYLR_007903 [Chrysophaeum taylorii]|uniref:Myosin motor domain-containing protein n=1 Tax=Chrysophaeum taylorii TaxID=2483200 RepID=A0AAD7ULL7_9STRA|nr:hypothetical protein CTAYLR_007903 [Chrysophaeum taylorii]
MVPEGGVRDEGEDYFWVADAGLSWVACRLVQRRADGGATLATPSGRQIVVHRLHSLEPVEASDVSTQTMDDLADLASVSEGAVLYQLGARYDEGRIYTQAGQVLLALRPKEESLLYSNDLKRRALILIDSDWGAQPEPHPYATAAAAWSRATRSPQSLVIAGESGSGKTTTRARILEWMAFAAPGDLDALPAAARVLDAFGSAKTPRNQVASMFGMITTITIARRRATSYRFEYVLFEARRARRGGQSFRAFYAAGRRRDARTALRLGENHAYLLDPVGSSRPNDDSAALLLADVERDLESLGYARDDIAEIFRIVAAVVHAGDVEFVDEGDGCGVSEASRKSLEWSTLLSGLGDAEALARALTGNGNWPPERASAARDALACALYEAVFAEGLVGRINRRDDDDDDVGLSVVGGEGSAATTIAVVDSPGFKTEEPDLDALCANFANEKLQHHFATVVLDGELAIYAAEGIAVSPPNIRTDDAASLVRLFEATLVPALGRAASDADFVAIFAAAARETDRCERVSDLLFSVDHFVVGGGTKVCYDSAGWREQNANEGLSIEGRSLAAKSASGIVRRFFSREEQKTQTARLRRASADLERLDAAVRGTRSRFIRCIRPGLKEGLDNPVVLAQLVAAGVFGALRVQRAPVGGYRARFHFGDFARRFGGLCATSLFPNEGDERVVAKAVRDDLLEEEVVVSADDVFVGKTRVLVRRRALARLEELRVSAARPFARRLQRWWRGRLAVIALFGSRREARDRERFARQARERERARIARDAAEREVRQVLAEVGAMGFEDELARVLRSDAFAAFEAAAAATREIERRAGAAISISRVARALVAKARARRLALLDALRAAASGAEDPVDLEKVKARCDAETSTARPRVRKDAAVRVALVAVDARLAACLAARDLRRDLRAALVFEKDPGSIDDAKRRRLEALERLARRIDDGSLLLDLVPHAEVEAVSRAADLATRQSAAKSALARAIDELEGRRDPTARADALMAALDAALAVDDFRHADADCARLVDAARKALDRLGPLLAARRALRRAVELASPRALRAALDRRAPFAIVYGAAVLGRELRVAKALLYDLLPTVLVDDVSGRETLDEEDFLAGTCESVPADAVLPPRVFSACSAARFEEEYDSSSYGRRKRSNRDEDLLRALLPRRRERDEALRVYGWVRAHATWRDNSAAAARRRLCLLDETTAARRIVRDAIARRRRRERENSTKQPRNGGGGGKRSSLESRVDDLKHEYPGMTTDELGSVEAFRRRCDQSTRASASLRARLDDRARRLDDTLTSMLSEYQTFTARHSRPQVWR